MSTCGYCLDIRRTSCRESTATILFRPGLDGRSSLRLEVAAIVSHISTSKGKSSLEPKCFVRKITGSSHLSGSFETTSYASGGICRRHNGSLRSGYDLFRKCPRAVGFQSHRWLIDIEDRYCVAFKAEYSLR